MLLKLSFYFSILTASIAYILIPTNYYGNSFRGKTIQNSAEISINFDVVRKVATLAQLEISDDEILEVLPRMQEFIKFADVIRDIKLTDRTIKTMVKTEETLRTDTVTNFDNQDAILSNFPKEEDGYLYVPRVTADLSG